VDRRLLRGQRSGSPTVINLSFLEWSCYFSFKELLSAGNRTRDLWVSSHELWPVDHRGGQLCSKLLLIQINWGLGGGAEVFWNKQYSLSMNQEISLQNLENIWKDIFWDVTPCGSCKNRHFRGMSVLTRATWCNIPEDGTLHSHCRENLKYYVWK
jgi:hypothetical protein